MTATVSAGLVVGAVAFGLAQSQRASEDAVRVAAHETPLPESSIEASDGATGGVVAGSMLTSSPLEVEVPDVVGDDLKTARWRLESASLRVVARATTAKSGGQEAGDVVTQDPAPGVVIPSGASVTLAYVGSGAEGTGEQRIVVIDPGHQEKADLRPEPIGPGSSLTKERVRGGTTGCATGIPEYRRALQVSRLLRERLEGSGVRVMMTRNRDDANISNRERAILGNRVDADLVIRVHFDGVRDATVMGISTLYPGGNDWVRPISTKSKRAAALVHKAVLRSTGARDHGVHPRSDMTGFNWSRVPTIIVECGFLSNPAEDRTTATTAYQQKLADGMAAGIMGFVGG